jgi:hypothetical protein
MPNGDWKNINTTMISLLDDHAVAFIHDSRTSSTAQARAYGFFFTFSILHFCFSGGIFDTLLYAFFANIFSIHSESYHIHVIYDHDYDLQFYIYLT